MLKMKYVRSVLVLLVVVAAGSLAGCNKGEGEKAGESIDRGAEKAKDAMKNAADKTGDAFKKAGEKLKDATTSTNK